VFIAVNLNFWSIGNLLGWLIVVFLVWRGERMLVRIPHLPVRAGESPLPRLSVIIPARDEAQNLPNLLDSLATQHYPGRLEVIVVDDDSSDGTAQIAQDHNVNLIQLTTLPEGWYGKPFACQTGAQAASGEWLLFTDADTIHAPLSAASAVAYAAENRLDGLNLLLEQQTNSPLEALTLGTAFTGLFSGIKSLRGFLNGQYILIRRDVFEAVGGFRTVRQQAIEDLAFGQLLLMHNYKLPLLHAETLVSVHMFQHAGQLWHGLTRLGAGTLLRLRWRSLLTVLVIAQLASPLLLASVALNGEIPWMIVILNWSAASILLIAWSRRMQAPALALLAPAGAVVIIFSGLWGLFQLASGLGNRWKGRRV
jgi:chlorobactene glucosyltransferase